MIPLLQSVLTVILFTTFAKSSVLMKVYIMYTQNNISYHAMQDFIFWLKSKKYYAPQVQTCDIWIMNRTFHDP